MIRQVSWQPGRPRQNHYEFAHRALPTIVLRREVDLLKLGAEGRLEDALRSTWLAISDRLPEEDRVPPDGFAAEVTGTADSEGGTLLIRFPEPLYPAEAHLAAVMPCEPVGRRRYFVLERSVTLQGETATVLGEWAAGSHINYGTGPAPDMQAFLAAVRQLTAGRRQPRRARGR